MYMEKFFSSSCSVWVFFPGSAKWVLEKTLSEICLLKIKTIAHKSSMSVRDPIEPWEIRIFVLTYGNLTYNGWSAIVVVNMSERNASGCRTQLFNVCVNQL